MHFGLMNVPGMFQIMMKDLFGDVSFVKGYINGVADNLRDIMEYLDQP